MSHFYLDWTELGWEFKKLVQDHSEWSDATFGVDFGPLGALKHLELEAREAQAEPSNAEEYADCLLLLLDASRRAGLNALQLVQWAQRKMEENKRRTWGKVVEGEPCQHVD